MISSIAYGQKKAFLGYEFGVGKSNIQSKNIYEDVPSSRTNFGFGVRYQKPISKVLNINAGAGLLMVGDKFNNFSVVTPHTSGDFERLGYRFGYLSLPVTAQFHTKKKILRWYGSAGLIGGIMLFHQASVAPHTPCFIHDETKFKRFEVGFTGSAGFELQYRLRARFYTEVRTNLGISDIVKSGPVPFHNRSLMVVIGHSTKLKK